MNTLYVVLCEVSNRLHAVQLSECCVFGNSASASLTANRGDLSPQNLAWGMLMQTVPPDFVMIPLRIHQNTPFQVKKKHFSGEELGLAHILPLLLTKPLESAPSFPAKQIYASANQTYIHGLLQPANARLFRLLLFSGKFLKLNMCVSSQQ